ncbi:hypothetical protein [Oerskovia enterophila]|uniref:Uncharacterized protein n=1 Tax=Oerskovia enterophila TaxID=43678 RepID=A0ABX2Y886_9CELL|nr:hypothetical protein [Oerskovia enterophila]OCI32807.1 hypothetical protein OERS_03990 [Oerskovia enterophila]
MNLQGHSEFFVESNRTLDDVIVEANRVLLLFAERSPIVTRAWAEADGPHDVRIRILTVSSSYAEVEGKFDALAHEVVVALQERLAGTRVSRGATELVPA